MFNVQMNRYCIIQMNYPLSKESLAWDFWKLVFHQTTPPGPIRGSLEPFLLFSDFYGAIQILKRLPGVRETGESIRNNEVGKLLP